VQRLGDAARHAVDRAAVVIVEEGVLVIDLDHRHARVVGIRQLGVGIDAGQQRLGIRLFGGDHQRIEKAQPFGEARDMQVHVDVDAALFQRRDQVILAIHRFRVQPEGLGRIRAERAGQPAAFAEDAGLRGGHEVAVLGVEVVQPHAVDAEAREPVGRFISLRVRREVRRPGQVGRMEPDAPLVRNEPSVLHPHEPVLAGRRVEQMRHADRVVRRVIRNQKREQRRRRFLRTDRQCHHAQHPADYAASFFHCFCPSPYSGFTVAPRRETDQLVLRKINLCFAHGRRRFRDDHAGRAASSRPPQR